MTVLLAYVAGIATGLSMALAYRWLWGRRSRPPSAADLRGPPVSCTACETAFPTREEARQHAMDVHNAFDAEMADAILEEGDG